MKILTPKGYREMTEEEIAEMKQNLPEIPEEVKNEVEERLEKLENLFNKIASFLGVNK